MCDLILIRSFLGGGRDSTPVRGVPYEPIALLRVYRAKIESNSSYAPGAVARRAMTSNRSSDDDDKIHETEALLLESKTTANDYLISQLLLRRYPLGRRSRVFTCPTVGNNVNSPIRTSAIGLLQHLQLLYIPSELDIDKQIQQVTLYFYCMQY
jgi:hypothetical protein